ENRRMRSVQDARGNLTTLGYATMDDQTVRLSSVARPPVGGTSARFTYAYDVTTGLLASFLDQNGNRTTLLWDDNGSRRAIIDPFGNRTTSLYNSSGQVRVGIDP